MVYANFNKWQGTDDGKFVLILTTLGTRVILQLTDTTPSEGLELRFWTDDGDAVGNFDPLIAEGVLRLDADDHWLGVCERESIMNVSQTPADHWARAVDWAGVSSALSTAVGKSHPSSTL